MEDIILQTVVKMIEEIVEVLLHGGMNNIGAVIQKLQKIAKTAVLEITGAAIEQGDAGVVAASSERKADACEYTKWGCCDGKGCPRFAEQDRTQL